MKNIPSLFKHLAFPVCLLLAPAACTNLEEDLYDRVTPDTFFKTEKDFAAAIGGAYTQLYLLGSHGGYFSIQEISSDEVIIPQRGGDWGNDEWFRAHRHEMTPYNPGVNSAWNNLYAGVLSCNRLIYQFEQLKKEDSGVPVNLDAYIAEIRALRALFYYFLLDSFGNIPIVTNFTDDNYIASTIPRAQVFDFVEQELTAVLPLLNKTVDATTYGKMNYYAAKALQAKLYLNAGVYTGTPRLDDCLAACDEIINAGHFALEGQYHDNFRTNNQGSSEFIFAVPFDENFAKGFNLHMMTLHYASQATYNLQQQPWNGYCSLQEFYDMHEDADVRKKNFIAGPQFAADGVTPLLDQAAEPDDPDGPQVNHTPEINTINTGALRQAGVRIGKYEFKSGATPDLDNDMPVFRYADILLTKAEALWRKDNNSTQALDLVNQVRNRAFEPDQPFTTLTAENLLAERGREMFYEGVRRQDQIRFGVYGNPTEFMPGSAPCKELWPIPSTQFLFGVNLQQNPCY